MQHTLSAFVNIHSSPLSQSALKQTSLVDEMNLKMQVSEVRAPQLGNSDSPLSLPINIFLSKTRSKITGVSVVSSNFLTHCVCFLLALQTSN